MKILFDPAKREKTLVDRGLDFADAALVFAGTTLETEDTRKSYGETRIICYGLLAGRMVVVGYTPRGADRHIFSMMDKPMNAKKPASPRSLTSDLARLDTPVVAPQEYEELPELTEDMLARAKVNKGGRPVSPNPRKLISLRLPADVIDRWKATGAGWQTRMAERLNKVHWPE
ncbi:MAG: BrnA antitoxin family protein [Polaromonas sp.]|uniref:BrnT family toxin n=1 Tax=Polaromonas sp. TaxID=1869339 RepID=UPI002733A437|nr:BrnT family toxin [Polaromonas sp.]MDP2820229.1 BrnA antitoxin family protein [Polaromonas sp.]